MKVVRSSVNELILEDRAILFRLFGAAFALFGLLFVHLAKDPGLMERIVPWAFVALGSGFAMLTRNTWIKFDRVDGQVSLSRVGIILPPKRLSIPLAAIASVDVEEDRDSDSTTYRVRLLLKEGDPVNFTEYSTSGRGAKDELAEAVRTWLGQSA
jgi:hypothetical protein